MDRKLRIGIIGTGGISHCHMAGYLAQADRVEVVAACDLSRPRREAFGARYGITSLYGDYHVMLADEDLDAVSVCIWNDGHRDASIAALQSGRNVLCEKPMAMNEQEARDMQAAAEASGKLLMIGFVRRFGTTTAAARDFIARGILGRIQYVKATYLRRNGNPGGWFSDRTRSGGGPLIDLGVHVMDLARYLCGGPMPISVYGATLSGKGVEGRIKGDERYRSVDFSDACDVEDFATALIRFDDGTVLSVETSFRLDLKEDEGSVRLFGTKGGLCLEPVFSIQTDMEDYLVDIAPRVGRSADPFLGEISHFVDCLSDGVPCLSPAADGVVLMRMIDAIYESARTGHEIRLS